MSLSSLYQQNIIKYYQRLLANHLKVQFTVMNMKEKSEKIEANEYRLFLKSIFVDVNRIFMLIYLNIDNDAERFKAPRNYLPRITFKN